MYSPVIIQQAQQQIVQLAVINIVPMVHIDRRIMINLIPQDLF
jgi:hypothetical protein